MANRTVLLIDYEPRSIEDTRRPLQEAGYRVEVAHDGEAGLAAFHRLHPDLVLVEAMLPKKHGFDVCQEIKRSDDGRETPVVITTGVYRGRKYRNQALKNFGCDEYLEKPFSSEALLEACNRFIQDDIHRVSSAAVETTADLPAETAPEGSGTREESKTPTGATDLESMTEEEISDRLDSLLADFGQSVEDARPEASKADDGTPTAEASEASSAVATSGESAGSEVASAPADAPPERPTTADEPAVESPSARVQTAPETAPAVEDEAAPAHDADARSATHVPPTRRRWPTVAAAVVVLGALTAAGAWYVTNRGSDSRGLVPDPDSRAAWAEPGAPTASTVVGDDRGAERLQGAGGLVGPLPLDTPTEPDAGASDGPTPSGSDRSPTRAARDDSTVISLGATSGSTERARTATPAGTREAASTASSAPPVAPVSDAPPTPRTGSAETPPVAPAVARPQPVAPAPASTKPVAPRDAEVEPDSAAIARPMATRPDAATEAEDADAPTATVAPGTVSTGSGVPATTEAASETTSPVRREPVATADTESAGAALDADPGAARADRARRGPAPIEPAAPEVRPGDLIPLSECDVPPVAVDKTSPRYHPFARKLRQEGTVVVRVRVDETGRVGEVELVRGIPKSVLNDEVVDAVRRWRYRPGTKDGVPVKVWKTESFQFRL